MTDSIATTNVTVEAVAETSETAAQVPAPQKSTRDLTNLRHRPFLVVRTITRPAKGVNTSKKGWAADQNNWSIFETASVEDRVSGRTMSEATVIVDVMRGNCVTNRFDRASDQEVAKHYLEKYRDSVERAMDLWLSKMARKMAAEPHFARGKPEAEAASPAAE
jgi:hypothetical protein